MTAKEKPRLLLVDDEEDLRTVLGQELSAAGYEVVTAPDGVEAIRILQTEKFDVALLDIQMPNKDGIAVLKHLSENHPSTIAIILTGHADLYHAMEAKKYGAREFISKPFQIDDVTSTLQRLLQK